MSLLRTRHHHGASPAPRDARRLARRAVAVALATASIVALAGCQAGADSGKTELSFFSWDNEATMKPIITAFEKENPDIDVKFSTAPPVAEYISTLQTRLLSGTAADVFLIAAENKTNLIEGGYVEDLTDKPFMDVAAEFNTETYSADGKAYGLSVASWGGGIMYNTALTSAAGMTDPPQSWDEFIELCKNLQDSGVTPYLESGQGITIALAALIGLENAAEDGQLDAKIFDGESTFADEWTAPLETFNELFTEGVVTRDIVGLGGDQVMDEFVNGRVAMIGTGPWSVGTVRESAPDMEINFMAVPGPEGETYFAGAASPGYAINAKTEHKAEAEKFLTFLASEGAMETYNEQTSAITTTSNFTPVIDPALDTVAEGVQAGRIYLPQIAWPRYQDALATDATARLQEMIQGQITPADVAKALDQKLKDLGG